MKTTNYDIYPEFKNLTHFTEWLQNQEDMPKTITLRAVYKTSKLTVQPPKNKKGQFVGIMTTESRMSREMRESGEYIVTENNKRVLEEGVTFDLAREEDQLDWEFVKYCNKIVLTEKEARTKEGVFFFIELPEMSAAQGVKRVRRKKHAFDLIEELKLSQYVTTAEMLGCKAAERLSHIQVLNWLYSYIETESGPEKVIKVLTDPDYAYLRLLLAARKKAVIRQINGMFFYGEHELGFSEQQVIAFLKDKPRNESLINAIISETEGITFTDRNEVQKQVDEALSSNPMNEDGENEKESSSATTQTTKRRMRRKSQ